MPVAGRKHGFRKMIKHDKMVILREEIFSVSDPLPDEPEHYLPVFHEHGRRHEDQLIVA